MRTNDFLKIFTIGFCLVAPTQLVAQVTPTVDPGRIISDFEEQEREPSRIQDTITLGDRDTVPSNASVEKVFTLENVTLDGSSVYSESQVRDMALDYMGKPVSFADLNDIARAVTLRYRADGYMFSRVILPPQEIERGVVRLSAFEGRLTDIEVVGNYKDDNNLIADFAEKLKSEGPANAKDIERYLLLIDDLPGITARSVLQPSETPGGGKMILTIEQDDFEGSVSMDNRGSRFLGQTRGMVVAAFNSLFGVHDRTTVRGIVTRDTDELKFFDIMHEEQIGTEGLRLKGRYASTKTQPGYTLDPLDVKGDSDLFDIELAYPLLRSRQYNMNLIGGFTVLNSESDISNIEVSNDHLRYLRAGADFDFTDAWAGVTQVNLELAHGVDFLGSTEDGSGRSRANGEHDFFRKNLSIVRLQDLPSNFSTQISFSGQHSSDPLLASEEFAVGGGEYGRAYDSGEIAGDKGVSGALELRYGRPVQHDLVKSYQFYGFYDIGKVWNLEPVAGEEKSASLASAGVGVRFNLDHDVSGSLEFNKPLTRNVSAEGNDHSRFFFNILKRF